MLTECASYTCTKPKKSVELQVPVLTSIEQAEAFLVTIAQENELDPVELMAAVKHWIESKRAAQELDIKREDPNKPIPIQIIGGMPDLIGANVSMPTQDDRGRPIIRTNGHGPVIDHTDAPALPDAPQPEAGDA